MANDCAVASHAVPKTVSAIISARSGPSLPIGTPATNAVVATNRAANDSARLWRWPVRPQVHSECLPSGNRVTSAQSLVTSSDRVLKIRRKCIFTYDESVEIRMADKQSEADKAQAMKEYREARDAAVQRIATLRAARLARDAAAPPTQKKGKKTPPK
jgi:hypothetical protein